MGTEAVDVDATEAQKVQHVRMQGGEKKKRKEETL